MSFISKKRLIGSLLLLALLLLSVGVAFADYGVKYDLPVGVTEHSEDAYKIHHILLWVCAAIAAVVFTVMIISLLLHRKSRGVTPATFHESTTMEVIWTIVPFAILGVLAYYGAVSLKRYENVHGEKPDLIVKVTGHQWYWEYEYVDNPAKLNVEGKIKFVSNILPDHKNDSLSGLNKDPSKRVDVMKKYKNEKENPYLLSVDKPLVLPVNKRILFLIKSNDVIHAWWVPHFGVKKDAIPHMVNPAWTKIKKPGTYRGQCAELCGTLHAYMPIVVKALPEKDFNDWRKAEASKQPKLTKITGDTASKSVLMANGKILYGQQCQACHQATGAGLPPSFPALKGSKLVNGNDFSEHLKIIIKGKGNMKAFGNLSDADIAAIATYERNAWGNSGAVVQPKDVAAARKAK